MKIAIVTDSDGKNLNVIDQDSGETIPNITSIYFKASATGGCECQLTILNPVLNIKADEPTIVYSK